jgi:hypothetical protein
MRHEPANPLKATTRCKAIAQRTPLEDRLDTPAGAE